MSSFQVKFGSTPSPLPVYLPPQYKEPPDATASCIDSILSSVYTVLSYVDPIRSCMNPILAFIS